MSSIDPSSKLSGVTPPPLQLNTTGGEGSGGASTTYGDVIMGGPQMDYFLNTQEASISASLDQFNQNLGITEEFQSDVQALLNAINEVPILTPDEVANLNENEAYNLFLQTAQALDDVEDAETNLSAFYQQPSTQAWLSQNPDFANQMHDWFSTGYDALYQRISGEKDDLQNVYDAFSSGNTGNIPTYDSWLDNYTGAVDTSSLNSIMESLTTISSSETTQFSVLTKEQLSLIKSMQNLLTTISQTASQIVNEISPY